MDEVFLIPLALGALALVLAAPVLAIVALLRTRRVVELEKRIERLAERLDDLERGEPIVHAAKATKESPAASEPTTATLATESVPRERWAAHLESLLESDLEPAAPPSAEGEPTPSAPPPLEPPTAGAGSPGPPALPSSRDRIDWERWLGVRGAAVVAGIALALAAILAYRHAVTVGWITPEMRVAAGVVLGVLLLASGEIARRRALRVVPAALQGAGVVALYAVIWAASRRYAMIGIGIAFPLMGVVTALACVLALRHREQLLAALALVGGFATPLLLTTGEDRPIGLFGYLLLLDLGLLFVGRRRGWAWLGILALLATFGFESLWIIDRMGPERIVLGLGILALFALIFALSGWRLPASERQRFFAAQAAALLLPFALALWFAGKVEYHGPLWQTGVLIAALTAGACVMGRAERQGWLELGAIAAGASVVLVWILQGELVARGDAWQLALVVSVLAAIPHGFLEHGARGAAKRTESPFAWSELLSVPAHGAWLLVLCASASRGPSLAPWPLALALLLVGVLVARAAELSRRPGGLLFAPFATGLALAIYADRHLGWNPTLELDGRAFLGVAVALAALWLAWSTRASAGLAAYGVGLFVLPLVVELDPTPLFRAHDPWLWPGFSLASAALVFAAARARSSALLLAVAQGSALALTIDWVGRFTGEPRAPLDASIGLGLAFACAALLLGGPALAFARFAGARWSWRVVGVAALLWIIPLAELHEARFGNASDWAAPLALGLVLALASLRIHGSAAGAASAELTHASVWTAGAAALLLAAVPAFAPETIAAALGDAARMGAQPHSMDVWCGLGALALACVGRRLKHGPAASLAALLGFLCALLLVGRSFDSYGWRRSDALVWNWISWVHLVPALALGWTALLVHAVEDRLRFPLRVARTVAAGASAIALVFLWLNLEILNHFTLEDHVTWRFGGLPARDLAMSIAWALYGIALLFAGTWKRITALRWASLALLLLAIAKVFLLDLGDLEGLYRVASLGGLAVSLLAVSIFYQRVVFRRAAPA